MTGEIKAFLSQTQHTRARIRVKQERLQGWQDLATAISNPPGGNGSSPQRDVKKMERYMTEVLDLETQIQNDIFYLTQLEITIESMIKGIGDPILQTILEMRYLKGMSFIEISFRVNYSYRWVLELHKRGLEEIEKECTSLHICT